MTKDKLFKKFMEKRMGTRGRIDKNGDPIEFKLSFKEYCKLWEESGKEPSRDWVLSRKNDVGHYEINNVYVNHHIQNVLDGMGLNDEYENKITKYAIETGYKRTTIKNMLKKGKLKL